MTNIIKHEETKSLQPSLMEMAKIALKSGKYPREYDEATIMNIFLTAKDLGISPMKALNGGFYIVNGKISMATTLMVDRIRSAGHSIKIVEWVKEKCVIIGKRKDNEDSAKVEFTMEDAQLAGLWGTATWKKYPKVMLYNRAMSMLARVLFPDVVGNAYSEDEKYEIQGIPAEKRPLEDMGEVISVNTHTGEMLLLSEECITEEQCGELDGYLLGDHKAKDLLMQRFSLTDIYQIKRDRFEQVIAWLKGRKEAANGQAVVA